MSAMPPLGTPVTDAAVHYPELAPVRDAVARRDWPQLIQLVAALSPELRYLGASMAGPRILRIGADEIARMAPDSTQTTRTLAAVAYIDAGWKIRSGYTANHVTQRQFEAFHDHLRLAERQLIEATAHDPADAAAWTMRITVARGLQLGQNEAKRRYAQLAKHHPHFYSAQAQLLQQLCPKWSGSWEAAHAFAHECVDAAPEGSVNGALVPDVYIERWLFADGNTGVKLLREEKVQAEVRAAAARSVLHSAATRAPGWVGAHGTFAAYWSIVGDFASAATHFRALGDYASKFPWTYFGDDVGASFAKYRNKAMAKG